MDETLRDHPPVVNTRRVVAGEEVVIDLHGRPFGGEPRPCPGRELALALAGAILEVLCTGETQPFDGVYEDWPNMRIPARLQVRFAARDVFGCEAGSATKTRQAEVTA